MGLIAATAEPLFAQDAPAAANTSTNTQGAAPGGGRRGGGRRGGPDLGPLPEIHAAVPNTLPGLLGKPIKWVSTDILVAPQNDPTHFLYSIKDPTIFHYNNKWEIYATANMVSGPAAAALLNPSTNQPSAGGRRGGGSVWSMIHTSFADWKDAPNLLHGRQTRL